MWQARQCATWQQEVRVSRQNCGLTAMPVTQAKGLVALRSGPEVLLKYYTKSEPTCPSLPWRYMGLFPAWQG